MLRRSATIKLMMHVQQDRELYELKPRCRILLIRANEEEIIKSPRLN